MIFLTTMVWCIVIGFLLILFLGAFTIDQRRKHRQAGGEARTEEPYFGNEHFQPWSHENPIEYLQVQTGGKVHKPDEKTSLLQWKATFENILTPRETHPNFPRPGEIPFEVRLRETDSKTLFVRMKTVWTDSKFRLLIRPDDESNFERLFKRMNDVEIGSHSFDRDFYVHTNSSRTLLINLLSLKAQRLIMEFDQRFGFTIVGGEVCLDFLLPRKSAEIDSLEIYRVLELFLSCYIEMSKQLMEVDHIHVIDGTEQWELKLSSNPVATCMVCGELIESSPVKCTRCETPHHRECWDYLGVCSTYACGGRKTH